MDLEDRQNNQHDNLAQDAELDSAVHRGLSSVDNVESGFHILARMIADFHLRAKAHTSTAHQMKSLTIHHVRLIP